MINRLLVNFRIPILKTSYHYGSTNNKISKYSSYLTMQCTICTICTLRFSLLNIAYYHCYLGTKIAILQLGLLYTSINYQPSCTL